MGKILISDEDFKLITNSIDFRVKKIAKFMRTTKDREAFEKAEAAGNKLRELSYRLRVARRELQ